MKAILRSLIAVLTVGLCLLLAIPATSAATGTAPGRAVAGHSVLSASAPEGIGIWPVLRQGGSNSAVTVRSLQYLLNAHGARLVVDGIFGARTNSAVRSYQAGHGLVIDGIVGPRTWSSLLVTVHRGSVGQAVKSVQDQMNARNIAAGGKAYLAVDGVFGAKTEAAVYRFQNRVADYWTLTVDGIVGPQTWQPLISNVLPRG